jgi:folate-binding protein YgfZ
MTAFADRPGAVTDAGRVLHFGDPMREQRALATGNAVVALADLAVIEVAGPDRLTWLDSITSQAVTKLAPGESTELLILDPQGRIEHAAAVFDDGASTWLMADADAVTSLVAWLSRMVFRADVRVSEHPELLAIGFFADGPAEQQATKAAASPAGIALVWADPWSSVQPGGHQYAATTEHPAADYHWRVAVVPSENVDSFVGMDVAGTLAAESLRIAAWRPRWSSEVDEKSLPHETDWLRSAVHLNKGCYRGQETVAKVHNLGHPPRRLVLLQLDGTAETLPAKGDPVFLGEKAVGHITAAARHYEDGPIALAILSRRTPATDLLVHSQGVQIDAAQLVIVPEDAGATADVPKLTRLSRRQ